MYEIITGDCLGGLQMLPDKYANMCFTSPPYNLKLRVRGGKYVSRGKDNSIGCNKYLHYNDDLPIHEYYSFHKQVLQELLRVSGLVFWNVQIVTGSKEAIFKITGDYAEYIKDVIIWDKGHGQPAMNSNTLNKATELIFVFESPAVKGRALTTAYFERGTMPDIWRCKRAKPIKGHGARFPQDLVDKAILNFSQPGDIIIDPFAGTGTTGVSALKNNRRFLGYEIDETYSSIAKKELQKVWSEYVL